MAGGGHRSTLKQKNKSHNHGKHRSKRNMKRESQGRVNVKQLTKEKSLKDAVRREVLKNREEKRDGAVDIRRGATITPPRVVVVVSLHTSVDTQMIVDLLKEAELSADCNVSEQLNVHISAAKLKKRMTILVPEFGDLQSTLDAAKVADVLLFVQGENGMDHYGEHCLTAIIGQGVPAHIFVSQGLLNLSKKKLSEAKKRIERHIDKSFPGEKSRPIDTWQDSQVLWRQITNIGHKPIHFRDCRPYLFSEKVEFESNPVEDEDPELEPGLGSLKLSGYLRGKELDVNQLVHLPGWGDFQMSYIDQSDDPYPLVVKEKDRRQRKLPCEGTVDEDMTEVNSKSVRLATADKPESLQAEVIPDAMDQEQTWPSAEELGEDKPSKVKGLKGVSDYQSNWILDMGDADSDDADSDGSDDEDMEPTGEGSESPSDASDVEQDDHQDTATENDNTDNYDELMDMDEEKQMYERMKEERLHVHFPDEVDTPIDTAARVRFARYRGMDSFHTTQWDPNEMLPYDYARIYRVSKHHYKRLKKISIAPEDDECQLGDNLPAEPGNFITVCVRNVPKSFMDFHKPGSPVTLFGLFKNEQKMTLVSAMIARSPDFQAPVKAKDPLVFQIGFRRFSTCPIFSEYAHQNKFKMERFLPKKGFIVASMYAPIMFAPAPVLVFRENVMQKHDLVAKGSLLPLDTNRIVIKRVVLSGAPFKINKKTVTVRYMFFNREDIEFYKPIELKTKWGKRGHIKQALGTHGHMKCTFNGQLKSEDTVMMHLYKRVFPKWSFDPHVSILPPAISSTPAASSMDHAEVCDLDDDADTQQGEAYKMFD